MRYKEFDVPLAKNPSIRMKVVPGHFTTNSFHITHYMDLNNLKTNASVARQVAKELAAPYLSDTPVDTIVCIEGTEVIGAYLAEELLQRGSRFRSSDRQIHVVVPVNNVYRKLMFQHDMQELIDNKNIILLVSSISSGTTLGSALECLRYYGGKVVGISTLFNAHPEQFGQEIHSMFTSHDIPGYKLYSPNNCPICDEGRKLDAIIIHDGYIKI
jgi:orotate phosphoribosyltransferase